MHDKETETDTEIALICEFNENGTLIRVRDPRNPDEPAFQVDGYGPVAPISGEIIDGPTPPISLVAIQPIQIYTYERSSVGARAKKRTSVYIQGRFYPPIT